MSGSGDNLTNADIQSSHLGDMKFGDEMKGEDAFSGYPLYHIEWQPEARHPEPGDPSLEASIVIPQGARPSDIAVQAQRSAAEPQLHAVSISVKYETSAGTAQTAAMPLANNEAASPGVASSFCNIALSAHEQVKGFSGFARNGRILALSVDTNLGTSACTFDAVKEADADVEPFEVWLQDGALFNGFAISRGPPAAPYRAGSCR